MVVFSLGKTFYLSKFRILLSFSVSTLWWCLEKGGIRGVWCFDSIFERIQENQLWQTPFFQWEIRQKQVQKSQIGKCAKTWFTFNIDERKTPWQDFETYSGMYVSFYTDFELQTAPWLTIIYGTVVRDFESEAKTR